VAGIASEYLHLCHVAQSVWRAAWQQRDALLPRLVATVAKNCALDTVKQWVGAEGSE